MESKADCKDWFHLISEESREGAHAGGCCEISQGNLELQHTHKRHNIMQD